MTNTWFISDTHFGHRNIITFKDNEGNLCRPFSSIEEHDETIIENHNKVVKPHDKVYHLGDVAINKKSIETVSKLNGKKILIKGNHDIFKLNDYTPYFTDIRSYKIMPKHNLIISHIPVVLSERWEFNLHGHTHSNFTLTPEGLIDKRYINVCLEQTSFNPVSFEEVLEIIKKRKETLDNS